MICQEHISLISESLSPKFYSFLEWIMKGDPKEIIDAWALAEAKKYFIDKGIYEDVVDEILKEKCVMCLLKDSTLFMVFKTFETLAIERLYGYSIAYSREHPDIKTIFPLPLDKHA